MTGSAPRHYRGFEMKARTDIQRVVTDKVISSLEAGVKPWECPWTRTNVHPIPQNFATQNSYSGINIMLLWMAVHERGFSRNDWLTFKQASALGLKVRKGEKSTQCIFVKPVETIDKQLSTEDEEVTKRYLVYKPFALFNVEQLEDHDLLNVEDAETANLVGGYEGDTSRFIDKIATDYCSSTGVRVVHGGNQAYYSPAQDLVNIPKTFQSGEAYAAVLVHELIHSTGHETRLDRFAKGVGGTHKMREEYAKEEILTELATHFVCAELGVNSNHENHVSYLESWIKALKEDKTFIFKAAAGASKAHSFFLDTAFTKTESKAA